MLYLVPGYKAEGSGLVLTFDENRTLSSYPDKDLYYNMTPSAGQLQFFTVDLVAPQKESQVLYYLVAVGLVLALGFAYAYSRRSRSLGEASSSGEPDSAEADVAVPAEETMSEDDSARRKELVARKKDVFAEIDNIKEQISSGEISRKDGEARLGMLKREFKSVRNELNRLPRKVVPAPVGQSPESSEQATSGYESLLAALARIDDDFEKGRLPENTYKSLRKEYVSKAAKALSSGSLGESPSTSPLEAEKRKIMDAILALDEEREKGEIDEEVYAELRASYRKQLVELMKKSEHESNEV